MGAWTPAPANKIKSDGQKNREKEYEMKKFLASAAIVALLCLMAAPAFAQAGPEGAAAGKATQALLGAGIGIGIAAFGGALGQGKTAAAALEGIARNPGATDKMFVPMILGLVLIESLVIYALVVEILILFS
jgi:F-type H+-transporting ATPase subunit c